MTKKNNSENKNNNKNDDIERSNNGIKDHVKNAKINFHQKRPSQMMKTFIKYSRRKPE